MAETFGATAWEYRMLTHGTTRDREVDQSRLEELNELGLEGWELVSAVPINSPDGCDAG